MLGIMLLRVSIKSSIISTKDALENRSIALYDELGRIQTMQQVGYKLPLTLMVVFRYWKQLSADLRSFKFFSYRLISNHTQV
jgi:hypothetical protein